MKSLLLVIGFLFCLFHNSLQGFGWTFYYDNNCTHPTTQMTYYPSGCVTTTQYTSQSWSCSSSGGLMVSFWATSSSCAGTPTSTTKNPVTVNSCQPYGSVGSQMIDCSYTLPPAADIAASSVTSAEEGCTGPTTVALYYPSTCLWQSSTTSEQLSCGSGGITLRTYYNSTTCSGSSINSTISFASGCTGNTNRGCGFIAPVGAGAQHTVVIGALVLALVAYFF